MQTYSTKNGRYMITPSGKEVDLLAVFEELERDTLTLAKNNPKVRAYRTELDAIRKIVDEIKEKGA